MLLPTNRCSFGLVGYPSPSKCFVFNGDFVDRGAWGLEVVLLLAALKVASPACVALVRGNHESLYCRWESQVASNRWMLPKDQQQHSTVRVGEPSALPLLQTFEVCAAEKVCAKRLRCSWVYGFRAEVLAKYGELEKEGEVCAIAMPRKSVATWAQAGVFHS